MDILIIIYSQSMDNNPSLQSSLYALKTMIMLNDPQRNIQNKLHTMDKYETNTHFWNREFLVFRDS